MSLLPPIDSVTGVNFQNERERIDAAIKESTANVTKFSEEAEVNMRKAAEDTAASAVQLATLAQKKLDVAIKSLMSGKLLDPAAGQEN